MLTTLHTYLREANISDLEFAGAVGDCTEHAVRKWRYGERRPRPGKMERIAAVTDGAVPVTAWFTSAAGSIEIVPSNRVSS